MGGGGRVTIGYQYFMGIHKIWCHGEIDSVEKIFVGEREILDSPVTSSQTIEINKPDLFGGKKKEGGIVGTLDIEFGEATQGKNAYLLGFTKDTAIPAYRGVVGFVLNKMYLTAMSPVPKPWSATIKRIPAKAWYPAKADINNGSANGAHIIYETLTSAEWGLGNPPNTLDLTSFTKAADTLYSEGLGLSLMFSRQEEILGFLKIILQHVNGMLYTDKKTGLFTLKLMRDDYDSGLLEVLDENMIIELKSFDRSGYAEMVNEMVVVYRKRGARKTSSVTVQDLGSVQTQNGIVSQTVNYEGIDTNQNASKIGLRDLRQQSTPLAQIQFITNRKGWKLNEGDVYKLSWPDLGIDQITIRIITVAHADLKSGKISVTAVEDVFSFPDTTYIEDQPTKWVEPVTAPVPVEEQKLINTPYYDYAIVGFDKETIEAVLSRAVMLAQRPPTLASSNYNLLLSYSDELDYIDNEEAEYTPTGKTGTALDYLDSSVSFTDVVDLEFVEVGKYAYINDEMILINSVVVSTKTITFGRGLFDTIPAKHPVGSIVFFAQDNDKNSNSEYAPFDTLYAKALPRTGAGLLLKGAAVSTSVLLNERHLKVYPPANIKINLTYYLEDIVGSSVADIRISFSGRNRLSQITENIDDWVSGHLTPEAGAYSKFFFENDNLDIIYGSDELETGTNDDFYFEVDKEKLNSDLWVLEADRNLSQADFGIVVKNESDELRLIGQGKANNYMYMQKHESDYYGIGIDENVDPIAIRSYKVLESTGAETHNSSSYDSFQAANYIQNPFSIKTGIITRITDDQNVFPDWRIINNDESENPAPKRPINFRQMVTDKRASKTRLLFLSTYVEVLRFTAINSKEEKQIFYHNFSINNIALPSGVTFLITEKTIEEIFTAPSTILDDANNGSIGDVPVSSYSDFESGDLKGAIDAVISGSLIYVVYTGKKASNLFNTLGKNLNIKDLLDSHIDIYSNYAIKTKRFTISGSTITDLDNRDGAYFSDRFNVADTEMVEVSQGGLGKIVNSSTGAEISNFNLLIGNQGMACDWVNEIIYVLGNDNRIYKYNSSGTLLDTSIAYPLQSTLPVRSVGAFSKRIHITDFGIILDISNSGLSILKKDFSTWVDAGLPAPEKQGGKLSTIYSITTLSTVADQDFFYMATEKHSIRDLFTINGGEKTKVRQLPEKRISGRLKIKAEGFRYKAPQNSNKTFEHELIRYGYGFIYGEYYGGK